MPGIDFLVHLPLLRIEQESVSFAGATLYRMPFEQYDANTLGAFTEQRSKYEHTEPVFLGFSISVPDEALDRRTPDHSGIAEMKSPSMSSDILDRLGLGIVKLAHQNIVTPVWSGLLLATPAAAFAPPSWSQTFVAADDGYSLRLESGPAIGARVQGPADHEYLFFPESSSERLTNDDLALAEQLAVAVVEWDQIPVLHAALSTLRATGIPVLSSQDRLTIAVQGLESLLLPEVHTQLKKTFARRVAALLASDQDPFEKLIKVAGDLYSLRSESIHGSSLPDDTEALQQAIAEQLLARSIRVMGAYLTAGETPETIRVRLDQGRTDASQRVDAGEPCPLRLSAAHRLARPVPSDVFAFTSSMAALDDRVCCWSPLIGLTTQDLDDVGGMPLGTRPAPLLMPLSPYELWSLEERDIRRDYLMEFMQNGHPMAVLMTTPEDDRPADAFAGKAQLERMQDLGVVALRLAGYDAFHDPELFGTTIFEGKRRLRWPTVLRQAIAEGLRHEAMQIVGPTQQKRLAELWAEVWRYESGGRSREIEYVLGLFRRSFDRDFLDPEHRATVLVSLFESMLGRFRAPDERLQLEDLVAALLGSGPDVAWFRSEGRKFRNLVAHGEFRDSETSALKIETLSRLVCCTLLELIKTWNDTEPAMRRRPASLLISRASDKLMPPAQT